MLSQKQRSKITYKNHNNYFDQKQIIKYLSYVLLLKTITHSLLAIEINIDISEKCIATKIDVMPITTIEKPFDLLKSDTHQKHVIKKGFNFRKRIDAIIRIPHRLFHTSEDVTRCLPWFCSSIHSTPTMEQCDSGGTNTESSMIQTHLINPYLPLPLDIILLIAEFLDHPDQLKLSHVNKTFRDAIDDDFWTRQIIKQDYLLWNSSLPKSRIFFANYYYHHGFGREPKLPERIVSSAEDVKELPNPFFAKKALILGFPKGEENYREVQHVNFKKSRARSSCEDYTFVDYHVSFFSSYEG